MFNVLVCLLGSLVMVLGAVAAFSLGPNRTVIIKEEAVDPTNAKTPEYVVWDGREVVVHPARVSVQLDVDAAELSDSEIDAIAARALRGPRGGDVRERFRELYWQASDDKIEAQIQGTPVDDLLASITSRSQERYVVVLVRPSGFDSFRSVRDFLIRRDIDVGYEPIEQSFRVRVR
jgi:hypothetical protein